MQNFEIALYKVLKYLHPGNYHNVTFRFWMEIRGKMGNINGISRPDYYTLRKAAQNCLRQYGSAAVIQLSILKVYIAP